MAGCAQRVPARGVPGYGLAEATLATVRAAAANVEPYIRADGVQVDAEQLAHRWSGAAIGR